MLPITETFLKTAYSMKLLIIYLQIFIYIYKYAYTYLQAQKHFESIYENVDNVYLWLRISVQRSCVRSIFLFFS